MACNEDTTCLIHVATLKTRPSSLRRAALRDLMSRPRERLFLTGKLEVVFHHAPHKFGKRNLWRPSQLGARFTCVSAQEIDFGRTKIARVLVNMLLPIEFEASGRGVQELADRVRLSRGNDEILRLELL